MLNAMSKTVMYNLRHIPGIPNPFYTVYRNFSWKISPFPLDKYLTNYFNPLDQCFLTYSNSFIKKKEKHHFMEAEY